MICVLWSRFKKSGKIVSEGRVQSVVTCRSESGSTWVTADLRGRLSILFQYTGAQKEQRLLCWIFQDSLHISVSQFLPDYRRSSYCYCALLFEWVLFVMGVISQQNGELDLILGADWDIQCCRTFRDSWADLYCLPFPEMNLHQWKVYRDSISPMLCFLISQCITLQFQILCDSVHTPWSFINFFAKMHQQILW